MLADVLPSVLLVVSAVNAAILIYKGPGTSFGSVSAIQERLKASVRNQHHTVELVDWQYLHNEEWESRASLLIIPGGRDLLYVQYLTQPLLKRIHAFVGNGGSYLGICAGAYFSGKSLEFEKGREGYEVLGSRDLGLFDGAIKGAAFPGFNYADEETVKAVNLSYKDKKLALYYHGGGYFNVEQDPLFKAFATYADLETAAVIAGKVGKGRVILSGVHPEYTARNKDVPEHVKPLLGRFKNENRVFWVRTMKFLRIKTKKPRISSRSVVAAGCRVKAKQR